MTKQTNVENLRDLVSNLGGVAEGRTTAEVLDQLEDLVGKGEGGVTEGNLADKDLDDVFSD